MIDDCETMRLTLRLVLENAGFAITEASDGQDGLAKADAGGYDAIIADINMPVMDGLTFLKQIRNRALYKATPILMLTTEAREERKDQGRSSGATGWIIKPFHGDKLITALRQLLDTPQA